MVVNMNVSWTAWCVTVIYFMLAFPGSSKRWVKETWTPTYFYIGSDSNWYILLKWWHSCIYIQLNNVLSMLNSYSLHGPGTGSFHSFQQDCTSALCQRHNQVSVIRNLGHEYNWSGAIYMINAIVDEFPYLLVGRIEVSAGVPYFIPWFSKDVMHEKRECRIMSEVTAELVWKWCYRSWFLEHARFRGYSGAKVSLDRFAALSDMTFKVSV